MLPLIFILSNTCEGFLLFIESLQCKQILLAIFCFYLEKKCSKFLVFSLDLKKALRFPLKNNSWRVAGIQ